MDDAIAQFVQLLAVTQLPPAGYNQYAAGSPANHQRQANLRHYLRQMQARQPTCLLVGEAAGYRGCRLSGIPFTSEQLLREGTAAHGLFGPAGECQPTAEWPGLQREASATIVWQVLAQVQPLPLLWNAYPFHPHRPGNPQSNRPPGRDELALGAPFIARLLTLFPIRQVVAVGRHAAQSLARLGVAHQQVRHPAHGGKEAFASGIMRLCPGRGLLDEPG